MELTVQLVAKHKEGFKALDRWFSKDKGAKEDFSSLNPGDVIEADVSGDKWVKSFKIVTHGTSKSSSKTYSAPSDGNRDASIARAVALKAAIDFNAIERTDIPKTTKQFEAYLLTGSFSEESK